MRGAVAGMGSLLTGSVLVAFAAFCSAPAVWRELHPRTPPPRPDVWRLLRALLFALNGFLALVAVAALLAYHLGASWPRPAAAASTERARCADSAYPAVDRWRRRPFHRAPRIGSGRRT